jgi:hypothetical protein
VRKDTLLYTQSNHIAIASAIAFEARAADSEADLGSQPFVAMDNDVVFALDVDHPTATFIPQPTHS